MIPILDKNQIKIIDNYSIKNEPISSYDLMERAGTKCYEYIKKKIIQNTSSVIHVFCGIGNNGGDGLVIGRKLFLDGYTVNFYKIKFGKNQSSDFLLNEKKITDLNCKILTYSS